MSVGVGDVVNVVVGEKSAGPKLSSRVFERE